MAARSHANGDLRPAPRPEEPRIRVPPNRVEKGSGSAGLRPASRESAKPAPITPRHTNVRTAPPFESRSARPLAAPATRAVPSDRHRGPKSRATRIAHCEEARGRLGTPTSGQSSRWGPAPLGEAQRTAPRPATATCSPPPDPATATCSPADPATATCSAPTDPATATCSPRRSGYCDMFRSSRSR